MSATALISALSGTNSLKAASLFDVRGWVAVVTGGGTGLGLVTALALAENGAKVYITGRRPEPLDEAAKAFATRTSAANGAGEGGAIVAVQADVSTKEGIQKLVAAVGKDEKFINLLVNNHGVSQGATDITAVEQTPEALSKHMFDGEEFDTWLSTYRINSASYYFTSFAFLPLLAAAKSVGGFPEPGNIINISSMSGVTITSQRGQFNYNASKAATLSLSHQLATEFTRAGFGIRVNTVLPGYFPSGMTVIPNESNTGSVADSAVFKNKWGIPFARPGNAREYAGAILSLATNSYVTGAEHLIDGGWMIDQAF
ncbi:Rhamnolipids biosynthesis 3-oxoacyl-[acyl-carrier-protein] reductase [Vanrija pseudolonga]|uniref:Rhamnolipids biosynthesis 3-oxoacyl-[acyl-carrier-protein] reductase n=1 Tax=Vanrija pseudolonga TaxID=143232 RepID=A0AAF0Y6K1_9TREE|nr:Rhamnolipids biosynthesis 3-oxoacyl-[acyl-carrier-protein] reductase [Vanrija pseudolonga]